MLLTPEQIQLQWEIGIYPNIDEREYRDIPAVNQSLLKKCEKSVAHFKYWFDRIGIPKEEDDDEKRKELIIGTAVHCAILEPDKFADQYIDTGVNSKALKAYKDLTKENPEKICLTKKEFRICSGILESVQNTETAKNLLSLDSFNEVTGIWEFKERIVGEDILLPSKCRIDRYITLRGEPCLIDIKTTQDASVEGFRKSIFSWGYHVQAAFYLDIFSNITDKPHKRFIIIAIEKEPPYAIAVYELQAEDIRSGRMEYRKYLYDVARAVKYAEWDCYPDTINPIRLPDWSRGKFSL